MWNSLKKTHENEVQCKLYQVKHEWVSLSLGMCVFVCLCVCEFAQVCMEGRGVSNSEIVFMLEITFLPQTTGFKWLGALTPQPRVI